MKIYIEGEQSRAVCAYCKDLCSVTFRYADYETERGDSIPDVLQGFCDRCQQRLLLPPQSTPKIAPYYLRQNAMQEFRVPHAVEDALLYLGSEYKLEKPDIFKTILRFYLSGSNRLKWVKYIDASALGKSLSRLSFRMDEATDQLLLIRSEELAISKNRFITQMIWDAKDRLLADNSASTEFFRETKLLRAPEVRGE